MGKLVLDDSKKFTSLTKIYFRKCFEFMVKEDIKVKV